MALLDREMGLVVHAVEALDDRLLDLLDPLGGLAGIGVDADNRVVMNLGLEAGRPAAVAAQPGGAVTVQLAHPHQRSAGRLLWRDPARD